MMMHHLGEVILGKEERIWRENSSLGHVAFKMPMEDGRCPVRYCFDWLGAQQWKIRSINNISIGWWWYGVFELPKRVSAR